MKPRRKRVRIQAYVEPEVAERLAEATERRIQEELLGPGYVSVESHKHTSSGALTTTPASEQTKGPDNLALLGAVCARARDVHENHVRVEPGKRGREGHRSVIRRDGVIGLAHSHRADPGAVEAGVVPGEPRLDGSQLTEVGDQALHDLDKRQLALWMEQAASIPFFGAKKR